MLALRFELWDSKMRRGVQECIKNWVGRPMPEHRPNFRFVYPTIQILIAKTADRIELDITNPSQIWTLDRSANTPSYIYHSDLCSYRDIYISNGNHHVKMESPTLYYEVESGVVYYQKCNVKRRHRLVYNLDLHRDQLRVGIGYRQGKPKRYKVGSKSIEEGRQLLRKAIKQLDRHFGI